jgi:hypothetical protein
VTSEALLEVMGLESVALLVSPSAEVLSGVLVALSELL